MLPRPACGIAGNLVEGVVVTLGIVVVECNGVGLGIAAQREDVSYERVALSPFRGMSDGRYCASWMSRSVSWAKRASSAGVVIGADGA
jgi:hypothetical protein